MNGISGEDAILACLGRHFPNSHDSLLLGRGDDAAVVVTGKPLCMSSDLFLEDVHFRRAYFSPEEIGHKALAVNLSDMAACGAKPLGFTLCLGLPPHTGQDWLEAFCGGMAALAIKHDCALAGGDLSSCGRLCVAVTIWGECGKNGLPLLRGCRLPGDAIFAVGPLGLARVGLRVLESDGREAAAQWPEACAAHLRPTPRLEAASAIAAMADPLRLPALMDVSDGIARDLPRLLQGRAPERAYGAELCLSPENLHPEILRFAVGQGLDPVTEALLGGEDYALLGACAPELLPELRARIPDILPLGQVTERKKITVNGQTLITGGFDHFAAQ